VGINFSVEIQPLMRLNLVPESSGFPREGGNASRREAGSLASRVRIRRQAASCSVIDTYIIRFFEPHLSREK